MDSQESRLLIFGFAATCDPIAARLVSLSPKISDSRRDIAKLSGLEEQLACDNLYLLQILSRARPYRSKRFETPDA
jgi:hypothetical protein